MYNEILDFNLRFHKRIGKDYIALGKKNEKIYYKIFKNNNDLKVEKWDINSDSKIESEKNKEIKNKIEEYFCKIIKEIQKQK